VAALFVTAHFSSNQNCPFLSVLVAWDGLLACRSEMAAAALNAGPLDSRSL
jgi:hypothetical protein